MFEQNNQMIRALEDLITKTGKGRLISRARQLSDRYRSHIFTENGSPLLEADIEALAYATYRMPATYAAIRSVLGQAANQFEGAQPETHVDLGGGTGAAVWAASDVWPIATSTVFEHAAGAINLGSQLMHSCKDALLPDVQWVSESLDASTEIPSGDLITLSYALGELPLETQEEVVTKMAISGRLVVIVEPGTPDGFQRIIKARRLLLSAGMNILAPCPHGSTCPMVEKQDWCHFAARLSRTSLLQEVKSAPRNYEDEKFSFVVASREGQPVESRVVRRPQYAKGQVQLTLCTSPPSIDKINVTRRASALYRAARRADWGDEWPPPEQPTK